MASPEPTPVEAAPPPAAAAATTTATTTSPATAVLGGDESQDQDSNSKDPPPRVASVVVSPDELIDLIQAIKFAKEDASQRQVWKEISEELSQKEGFEFLAEVTLNDVKKVWKKALKRTADQRSASSGADHNNRNNSHRPTGNNNHSNNKNNNAKKDAETTTDALKTKLLEVHSKPSMFTVGRLAQEYQAMTIAEALGEQQQQEEHSLEEMKGYVHVFLDVPADRSGTKPHQALISFQKPHDSVNRQSHKAKGKTRTTKSSSQSSTSIINNKNNPNDNKDPSQPPPIIVKIQKAAPMNASDTTLYPMLCYDQTKTYKTFLHPDSDPDGYTKIAALITESGKQGALADLGGTKAYFYARLATTTTNSSSKKKEASILSINTVELAPPQSW